MEDNNSADDAPDASSGDHDESATAPTTGSQETGDDPGDSQTPSSPAEVLAGGLLGQPVRRDRIVLWLAAIVLSLTVAYVAWRYVGTLIVGVFAYYVTRPVFARINDRIESRTLAVAVALVTVALPVLVLIGWTLYVAVRSLSNVVDSDIGDQVAGLIQPYGDLTAIGADVTRTVEAVIADPLLLTQMELESVLAGSFSLLSAVVVELFTIGLHAFIVLIITFYLLRDDYRIAGWARGPS
ncbi:AI-2E family transporter [Halomicroarcula sp. GCM10025710]